MILYLYKLGTNTPALTIKNARSYTADSVTDEDGAVYRPLAEGYELSGKADCSETPAGRLPRGASHTGDPAGGAGDAGGGAAVRR